MHLRGRSSFLPQSSDMHVRVMRDSKFAVGVNVTGDLSRACPASLNWKSRREYVDGWLLI